jgi:diguanylate cyclase (GGDEF)-like protein
MLRSVGPRPLVSALLTTRAQPHNRPRSRRYPAEIVLKGGSINDALGHHAGDTVLQIAAQRLNEALRPDGVVGRVGGDEFVALLSAPVQPAEIDDIANRLHAALAEHIPVTHEIDSTATSYVWISASIGLVAVQSNEGRNAAEILRDADSAMYEAKRTGQATSRYEHKTGRKPAPRSAIARLRAWGLRAFGDAK